MILQNVQFNCELEDILVELVSQLRANNIPLIAKQRESGDHIQITCPYHSNGMERKPSAGIRKEDGVFHCFACGEVHSLQEVISHCFGHYDDILGKWGWNWLLKNFATISVEERKDVEINFIRDSADRIFNSRGITNFNSRGNTNKNEGQTGSVDILDKTYVSEQELQKYRYTHSYMYRRGLTDEVIELFDVGYDRDTKCITFPIRDVSGNCLFIARRSVITKYFNYPKGAEKPLYGLYELNKLEKFPSEIIVCESMLDALSFWTVGKYAVALNGLGNKLQIEQLKLLPCRKIILATDMDNKGILARDKLRKALSSTKIVTEYLFPKGRKDANDCTKEELLNLKEFL